MFEFVEESLNEVALFVQDGVEGRALAPIGLGRDIGGGPRLGNLGSDRITIVGLVGHHRTACAEGAEQFRRGLHVVCLPRRQYKRQGSAAPIRAGVDLGRQSPAPAPQTPLSRVFFEVATC